MSDREGLEQALTMALAVLNVLETQSAGYTTLTIPPPLQVQLEEKRKEVQSLETRLALLAGRRPASSPDNLPRRDFFVGRQEEIDRCLAALTPDERGWGATIDGIGGMGKTALAVEVGHIARERAWFDAYLFASAKTTWLSSEGVRQETLALSSLDAFVRESARLLGQMDLAYIADAAERRRALLEALRGRSALLVWDNLETLTAEERDAIAEFLRILPAPNKAIVTSRHRTGESALTIRLDRLAEPAAFELMDEIGRRYSRVAGELRRAGEGTRRRLYEAAGGNPLALHWTLGQVAQKGIPLDEALARLQGAARSPDLYAFLFAHSARDLADGDTAVLSALSVFQAPTQAAPLAEITGLSGNEVSIALERLVTLSLVNDVAGGRYSLHPLARAYVHAALSDEPASRPALAGLALSSEARRKALRYWLDYAQKYGGGGKDAHQTYGHLEAEWPNLEAAAASLRDQAGIPGTLEDREAAGMLVGLADALSNFLWFRGYWDEATRLGEWAYEAAKAMGDWRNAGWQAYDVAWIHYQRAETERTAAWAGRIAEAMERGGDRRVQAYATRLRGLVARQRGDLDEEERFYKEALAAYRDLGEEDSQSIVLNDLGDIASGREAYDEAETYFHQALALADKLGRKEYQASYAGNLGDVALARNRLKEARRWYERELALAREVGRHDLIASAHSGLAEVLEKEGRPAEALPLAEEALRIRELLRDSGLDGTRELVARLRQQVGPSG